SEIEKLPSGGSIETRGVAPSAALVAVAFAPTYKLLKRQALSSKSKHPLTVRDPGLNSSLRPKRKRPFAPHLYFPANTLHSHLQELQAARRRISLLPTHHHVVIITAKGNSSLTKRFCLIARHTFPILK
ncbi:hypothetical protein, partial [Pseudomonas viridiflava]|uniref:hypothetical protein n=1 Tax=Pseudomonas viridiflava TaxID=33069 RepID=UPI00197D6CA2